MANACNPLQGASFRAARKEIYPRTGFHPPTRRTQLAEGLLCILLCMLVTFEGKCLQGAESLLDEAPNHYPDLREDKALFKRFLENPYPIRKVTYRCVSEEDRGNVPVASVMIAQGSLQENTFFHMYMGDDTTQAKPSKRIVSGRSSDGTVWTLDGKAMSGTGGTVESAIAGTTTYTRATSRSTSALWELRTVAWFGLGMLVPHSLRWAGDTFSGNWHTPQWPQNTTIVAVSGQVLAFSNNLPLTIRLKSSAWPNSYRYVDIHFEYGALSGTQFYPRKIWSEAILKTGSARGRFYDQILIDFGRVELPKGGFKPSDFLPTKYSVVPISLVASNKGVFWENDGRLVKVEGAGSVTGSNGSSRFVRGVFLFILTFSAALLLVFALARGRWFSRGQNHTK